MDTKKVVITGAAGFIGSHLSRKLLEQGYYVIAIDSMNPYYDIRLKQTHLNLIKRLPQAEKNFHYHQFDINEPDRCRELLDTEKPTVIVHLAAQAGVRYCQAHPDEAENNNIKTTRLLLDLAHREGSSVKQFLYASSSSIYGTHPRPWKETYVPRPEGIYGESKAKGEVMCTEIFQKNKISIAAMRFFTVYGPFGRPDMAPGKFLDIIHRGKEVPVYGDGSAIRDFTYVDDIVQGIVLIIENPNYEEFEIYNLGKGTESPNSVIDLIKSIESNLNKKANINFTDPMAGDVPATQADITKAKTNLGYNPLYTLEEGIKKTVEIYLRHITKYLVVMLHVENSTSLKQQIEKISAQSNQPQMIVVLDSSNDSDSSQNQETLKNYPSVEYLRVSEDIWMPGMERLQEHLKAKKIESFEDASNIFVSFVADNINWVDNEFEEMIELISSNGYEFVSNPRCFLARLDIILSVLSSVQQNASDKFIESLTTAIKNENNVRVCTK